MIAVQKNARAFAATMRISAAMPPSDYFHVISGTLLSVLTFGALVGIWRGIPDEALANAGTTASTLITYAAISQAVSPLLGPRTTLADHIANGSIAVRLLWPMGVVAQFVSEWIGRVIPITIAGAVGVGLTAYSLGVDLSPKANLWLLGTSLLLGITVGIGIDFAFALLTVRLNNGIWFVSSIRAAITSILSGALIPLNVMPWHIGDILLLLPFASMASAPLQVYTVGDAASSAILLQAGWAIVLWAALFLWARYARDEVVTAGG